MSAPLKLLIGALIAHAAVCTIWAWAHCIRCWRDYRRARREFVPRPPLRPYVYSVKAVKLDP